ncbi:hypothetical protein N8865_02295, partial [Francisellaceae bacterium]|nr:hypothetical protein [Francisellaceae bacterium]
MKKTLIALSLASGLLVAGTAMAANTIGFVNTQQVFNTSSFGKAKIEMDNKDLKVEGKKLVKKIEGLQKQLIAFEDARNSSVVDSAVGDVKDAKKSLTKQGKDQEKLRTELKSLIKEYQANLMEARKDAEKDAKAFNTHLKAATKEVAQKEDLEAVLPSEFSLYGGKDV